MNDIASKLRLRPAELVILGCAVVLGCAAVAGAYAFRPADESTTVAASASTPTEAPATTTTVRVPTTEPAVEIPATTTTAAPTTTTVAPTTTTSTTTTTTTTLPPATTTTLPPTTTAPPTTTTAASWWMPDVVGMEMPFAEQELVAFGHAADVRRLCEAFTKPLQCTAFCANGIESYRSVVNEQSPSGGTSYSSPQLVVLRVIDIPVCLVDVEADMQRCYELAERGAASDAEESWFEMNCNGLGL